MLIVTWRIRSREVKGIDERKERWRCGGLVVVDRSGGKEESVNVVAN